MQTSGNWLCIPVDFGNSGKFRTIIWCEYLLLEWNTTLKMILFPLNHQAYRQSKRELYATCAFNNIIVIEQWI